MSTTTRDDIEIGLAVVGGPQREKNHRALQPVLTDLIAVSLTIKQLHWNVVGPRFRSVHLQLDEIYADVVTAIDTVAERIAATGHSPNGRLAEVAKTTELTDVPAGFLRDDEVLTQAVERIRELALLIRSRMGDLEDVDTVSADVLHSVVETLEKHHWMLQAQRQ